MGQAGILTLRLVPVSWSPEHLCLNAQIYFSHTETSETTHLFGCDT